MRVIAILSRLANDMPRGNQTVGTTTSVSQFRNNHQVFIGVGYIFGAVLSGAGNNPTQLSTTAAHVKKSYRFCIPGIFTTF